MNKKQKAQVPTLSRADKRVCKSYIDQSYLLNKYQTLKADTKEIVVSYFDKIKPSVSGEVPSPGIL